jgi:hypothetical protein
MDPPELASEPPRSRIELRAGVKTFGLVNVRDYDIGSMPTGPSHDIYDNVYVRQIHLTFNFKPKVSRVKQCRLDGNRCGL